MKIGIFTECYKPVMNGVSVSIETFKKGLEERGHEVFIFAPDNNDAESEPNVFRFPAVVDPRKRVYPFLVPSIEIQKTYLPIDVIKQLDVIHAQHMFTAGRLARYAAKRYNKPLIYTYHTLIAEYTHYLGLLSPLVKIYLKNMSKRFCNSCDQIITPSKSMKKILLKYKVKAPIEVIMTGIDPGAYKRVSRSAGQRLRKEYEIDPKDKILLYLSRIAKEKNIDFLLRAFKKISHNYPKCHLVLAGGGPEEDWCRARIKQYRIQNSVTMTGMVPKEEANELFGMADIFTFPSITETQGIVVAEAMASGTPPVAVGRMGPTDLINDGEDGYLTKLNIQDFSEKVLKLLKNDTLRKHFAEKGLERVDEFSTETSTNKLIKLYEKVIEKKEAEIAKN